MKRRLLAIFETRVRRLLRTGVGAPVRGRAGAEPSYRSEYVAVTGPNAAAIGRECDAIVKRLEARYGKPAYRRVFPVNYAPGPRGRGRRIHDLSDAERRRSRDLSNV